MGGGVGGGVGGGWSVQCTCTLRHYRDQGAWQEEILEDAVTLALTL